MNSNLKLCLILEVVPWDFILHSQTEEFIHSYLECLLRGFFLKEATKLNVVLFIQDRKWHFSCKIIQY